MDQTTTVCFGLAVEHHFDIISTNIPPINRPEVGPLIGGFINYHTSWRWSFWVLMIWAGVQLALIVFFVPETYHPVLLRRKARKLREETGDERWKAQIEVSNRSIPRTILLSCKRPFQLLFLEPMVSCQDSGTGPQA